MGKFLTLCYVVICLAYPDEFARPLLKAGRAMMTDLGAAIRTTVEAPLPRFRRDW